MEKKKGQSRRMKRSSKEDNMWDCSVCTYRNSPEAFKCLMCDVRKGTSTRKPRLNAELVAAQVAQVLPPKPKKIERSHSHRKTEGRTHFKGRPRLKNVDRSTAEHNAVTVNNVTVIITEFQPKQKSHSGSSAGSSGVTAAPSDNALSTGTTSSLNGSSITSSHTSSVVVTNGSLNGACEGTGDGSGVTGTMSSSEAGSMSDASESPNKHEVKAAEAIANKS